MKIYIILVVMLSSLNTFAASNDEVVIVACEKHSKIRYDGRKSNSFVVEVSFIEKEHYLMSFYSNGVLFLKQPAQWNLLTGFYEFGKYTLNLKEQSLDFEDGRRTYFSKCTRR